MTLLTTWPESGPESVVRRTSDPAEIAAALAPIGVRYEQWPIRADVWRTPTATPCSPRTARRSTS